MTREELRRLVDAATPGPWQPFIAYSGESGTPDEVGVYGGERTVHGTENTIISDWTLYGTEMLPDLEFIAAAREAVPSLLAQLDEAEVREQELRAALEELLHEAERLPEWAGEMFERRGVKFDKWPVLNHTSGEWTPANFDALDPEVRWQGIAFTLFTQMAIGPISGEIAAARAALAKGKP